MVHFLIIQYQLTNHILCTARCKKKLLHLWQLTNKQLTAQGSESRIAVISVEKEQTSSYMYISTKTKMEKNSHSNKLFEVSSKQWASKANSMVYTYKKRRIEIVYVGL